MDTVEMEYLEGGAYTAYRGTAAWGKISSMIVNVGGYCVTAASLARTCAASACATPIGTLVAVAAAMGFLIPVSLGGIQAAMTGIAILYTLGGGGFKASDVSFWKWEWTSVKSLNG